MALPVVPGPSPAATAAPPAVAVPVAPAPVQAAVALPVVPAPPPPAPAAVAVPVVPAPAPLHVAPPGLGDPPAEERHHIVENGMVDIGQGIRVTAAAWENVCKSKKNSIWVKELPVAMFGDRVLLESCVNGKCASSFQKFPDHPPKPGLCPHRMGVLKGEGHSACA
ncbi:unnamed protein product [Ixodes hexagonus]